MVDSSASSACASDSVHPVYTTEVYATEAEAKSEQKENIRFRFRHASDSAYNSVFRFTHDRKAPSTSDSDSDSVATAVNRPLICLEDLLYSFVAAYILIRAGKGCPKKRKNLSDNPERWSAEHLATLFKSPLF